MANIIYKRVTHFHRSLEDLYLISGMETACFLIDRIINANFRRAD